MEGGSGGRHGPSTIGGARGGLASKRSWLEGRQRRGREEERRWAGTYRQVELVSAHGQELVYIFVVELDRKVARCRLLSFRRVRFT